MCPCCCCYLRAASETSALGGVVQLKRLCLAAYPISAARERRSGMNRISHPDWVKLCVELNCAPNQNAFCYSHICWLQHLKQDNNCRWPNLGQYLLLPTFTDDHICSLQHLRRDNIYWWSNLGLYLLMLSIFLSGNICWWQHLRRDNSCRCPNN